MVTKNRPILFKIFFAAFGVSFLGSLPLGTITTTSLQLTVSGKITSAVLFTLATVFVEMAVVLLLLKKFKMGNFSDKIEKSIYPFAILFILFLAVKAFFDDPSGSYGVQAIEGLNSAFLLGIVIGILNPLQIPYWLAWNNFFLKKRLVNESLAAVSTYIFAIGLASFLAVGVYIIGGTYITKYYEEYNYILNIIFGIIYLALASYLTIHFYKKHYQSALKNV